MRKVTRRPRALRPFAGAALGLVLAASVSLAAAHDGFDEPRLQVLRELSLPEEIAEASDVRWLANDDLLVAVGGQGIYSWKVAASEAQLVATLAGTGLVGMGRYQDYSRLGATSIDDISFGGRLFGVYRRDATEVSLLKRIESVEDVDRQGDQMEASLGN